MLLKIASGQAAGYPGVYKGIAHPVQRGGDGPADGENQIQHTNGGVERENKPDPRKAGKAASAKADKGGQDRIAQPAHGI